MLYALAKAPFDGDPYNFDSDRNLAKKTILVIINAQSEKQAIAALNYEFRNTIDFRPIIKNAEEYHHAIKKYFCSGIGVKLQNYDSQIALRIVDYFAKKNVVCLPVHDSFIVVKYHRDELKDIMQQAFGDMFHAKIDVH